MTSNVDVDGWRRPWAQHAAALGAFVATAAACGVVMAHAFESQSVGQFFANVPESVVRGVLADVQRPVQILTPAAHDNRPKLKASHKAPAKPAATHVVTTVAHTTAPVTSPATPAAPAAPHRHSVATNRGHEHGHAAAVGHGHGLGRLWKHLADHATGIGTWPNYGSWGSPGNGLGLTAQHGRGEHGGHHDGWGSSSDAPGSGVQALGQTVRQTINSTVTSTTGELNGIGQSLNGLGQAFGGSAWSQRGSDDASDHGYSDEHGHGWSHDSWSDHSRSDHGWSHHGWSHP